MKQIVKFFIYVLLLGSVIYAQGGTNNLPMQGNERPSSRPTQQQDFYTGSKEGSGLPLGYLDPKKALIRYYVSSSIPAKHFKIFDGKYFDTKNIYVSCSKNGRDFSSAIIKFKVQPHHKKVTDLLVCSNSSYMFEFVTRLFKDTRLPREGFTYTFNIDGTKAPQGPFQYYREGGTKGYQIPVIQPIHLIVVEGFKIDKKNKGADYRELIKFFDA
ncbi:MAG: hypothetical protein V1647_07105, partial [Pseudomonadota bacterium]